MSNRENLSLCIQVFRETWHEFYNWEQAYCAHLLSSTRATAEVPSTTYSTTNVAATVTTLDPEVVEIPPFDDFKPSPAYESCTPIDINQYIGDDPDTMDFVPYADDPSFDVGGYSEEYSYVAWDTQFDDPDLEIIVLDVARRLHDQHGMSFSDIDATGVLPLQLLTLNPGDRLGLLDSATQRDFPSFHQELTLPCAPTEAMSAVETFKERLLPDFCFNLSCLHAYCSPHLIKPRFPPDPINPKLPNSDLRNTIQSPCSSDCCINSDADTAQWSEEDTQLLAMILHLEPDGLPCDMAVILRKPCNEVFSLRSRLIPSSVGKRRAGAKRAFHSVPASRIITKWSKNPDFFLSRPCEHDGPCKSGCPCFDTRRNCIRRCICDRSCPLRPRGCTCNPRSHGSNEFVGTACRTASDCRCRQARRECDPELCLNCDAKTRDPRTCLNTDIQHERTKAVEVKESAHGFGLFLSEPILEGEMVTEYTGEEILNDTTISRHWLAVHRNRNYVYGFNTGSAIDSAFEGNVARFINHSSSPNVITDAWMVNGDLRLGIFARYEMEAGTELLLDYGSKFFENNSQGNTEGDAI